jgi:Transglutaminase-like superfamily
MSCSKLGFILFFFFTTLSFSFTQKSENPFELYKNAKWLKGHDIAVSKSSEIYTFEIKNTEGVSRVEVTKNVNEWLHPAKVGQTFFNRIHINDETSVEEAKIKVKGSNKLSKSDILVHDVEQDDIFYSDARAVDYSLKFEQMNEMNHFYTEKIRDARYCTLVFFSAHYPKAEQEVVFEIPDWLDMDFKEFNFEGAKITKRITPNPKGGKRVVFTAKEIAGYKEEQKAPNAKKIFPHLMLLFKSFKKDGKKEQIFENVGDLYSWYNGICKNMGNNSGSLKPQVDKLIANKKTDLEKIESIFYWVQDNIRYIAFENGIMGFRPDACQNVYKNLYGDCKGMANLLKQMLVIANFDARLTWIGTNDIPYDYSTPCLAVDNHMICTVLLNGKKYFLDGTEDYIALDDYATRIQGRQVLIEDGKNHILDRVPTFKNDRNRVIQNIDLTLNKDVLNGNIKADYSGETKTRILYTYNHIANDKKVEALKTFIGSGNQNLTVKTVETSSTDDRKNAFKVKSDFDLTHVVSSSGNEMYFALDLDKDFGDYTIDSTRVYDWEFSYPFDDVTTTTLTLPAGYKLDYTPTPVVANSPFFKAEMKYEQKDSKLIYTKKFSISDLILKKKDFAEWNKIMKQIRAFYKDQVVLVKK